MMEDHGLDYTSLDDTSLENLPWEVRKMIVGVLDVPPDEIVLVSYNISIGTSPVQSAVGSLGSYHHEYKSSNYQITVALKSPTMMLTFKFTDQDVLAFSGMAHWGSGRDKVVV